jgi:hypothetical protein
VNDSPDDAIRDFIASATSEAPEPLDWRQVEQRAEAPDPRERRSLPWAIWLGSAASVTALAAGLLLLTVGDDQTIRTGGPSTTSKAPTTVDNGRAVSGGAPTGPTVPTDTIAPPSSFPGDPGGPVSGQIQRTVIGDITWTLLEGDASTLPTSVNTVIDGEFYARDGEITWRSSNGIDWEQVDLAPDGILGIFEIDGETWARRSSLDGQGLGRWNGEVFEPVDLPPSTAPVVDGLRATPSFATSPVALGEQWIVPVATRIGVPWDELYPGAIDPVWDAVTGTIRVIDMDSNEPVAVLEATLVEGDPARVDLRDTESGEVIVAATSPPGFDPDEFFRIITERSGFSHHEFLIGDRDGFDAVASPQPLAESVDLATIGNTLLATAVYSDTSLGADPAEYSQVVELWSSPDGRTWDRVEIPAPAGDRIDWIDIESDGSLALLSIVSGDENTQQAEWWSSVDGIDWTPTDAVSGFGSVRHTDVGWLQGDIYETGGLRVSSDGLVWEEIQFDIRPPAGPGGAGSMVHGDTIFVTTHEGDSRRMWVGRVTAP